MLANRSALLAIAIMICGIPTAMAQTSPPAPPGTNVGVLTCRRGPSIGLILGSRQRMACRFVPSGPFPPEMYAGVMGSIGLDLGITAGGGAGGTDARKTCRYLCRRQRFGRRRRWCRRQRAVWRLSPFDRAAAPVDRRLGGRQPVARCLQPSCAAGKWKEDHYENKSFRRFRWSLVASGRSLQWWGLRGR